MKKLFLSTLLLVLPLLASAYDFEAKNADDVTIYYNIINEGTELEVTNESYGSYSGEVNIPKVVYHNGNPLPVTSIGTSAFYNCTGLTSLTIPNSVTTIGNYAFEYCTGLTSVTIPNSVTTIGNGAFEYCTSLTSVTIPNSVTSIGGSAFSGCSGLTSVHITDLAAWCKIAFSYSESNPLYYAQHLFLNDEEIKDLVIPNSVTSIGNYTFYNCSGLTSVTIPNSVTTIGKWVFYDCTSLTSMTIGNSVTTIGDWAFNGCSGLTSVTIPNSVTTIGEGAFGSCRGLTSVHITDLEAWCKIVFSDSGSNPLYYSHHIFLNGEEIKDLVIPNSITSIGNFVFFECFGLTSVTIPNSVTSIGDRAFYDCRSLTSLTIPNSVTTIGDRSFYYCASLTSVTIPNSVTTIGDRAFGSCGGLTSVTIPNSVTTIGEGAFGSCTSLTSVTIPNSVTSIGKQAFYYCTNLTSVTLGNSITSIGIKAFYECNSLTSVISEMDNPCSIDEFCFDEDVFNNATLYIPEGTTESYQSTDYWNKFSSVEEGEPILETCATPTISYANKKLTFSCETEGVEYHYTITDTDIKSDVAGSIDLSATYEISVYATKSGYARSDVATATLVWANATLSGGEPIVTEAYAPTERIPVLISSRDGFLTVKSELEGQSVAVYSLDGKALWSAKVKGGQSTVATNQPKGTIVVVKVGDRSVKMKM